MFAAAIVVATIAPAATIGAIITIAIGTIAIAAMIAAGETAFVEAYVIAGSPTPVTPCGGCRQKLAEFGQGDARVTMATLSGVEEVMTMAELLPGAFGRAHMEG